jgi:hypothetical protein
MMILTFIVGVVCGAIIACGVIALLAMDHMNKLDE